MKYPPFLDFDAHSLVYLNYQKANINFLLAKSIQMKNSIQIIIFLFLSITTQAAINSNVDTIENDYLIILKAGETETPQDKLEKRTFRIGDGIAYSTNENLKIKRGEIIGFDDDMVFLETENGSTVEVPIKELNSIQKNSGWYKRYRKLSKIALISLGAGSLIYLLLYALVGPIVLTTFITFTATGLVLGIFSLVFISLLMQILLIALGLLLLFTLIAFIVSRSETPKFRFGKRWMAKLKK